MNRVGKMKVLLLSPLPPPIGGIAKWTEHILSQYQVEKPNGNVELFHLSMSSRVGYAMECGLSRVIYGIVNITVLFWCFLLKMRTLRPDIVHLASSASWGIIRDWLLLNVCKLYNVKTVVHFHFGRIPELRQRKNWEWILLTKVIKKADLVLVIDPFSFKTLLAAGFTNIYQLPNPLSNSCINGIEQIGSVSREVRTVLFVGHMIKTKGIFELINACREIPDVQVRMCGRTSNSVKKELLEYAGRDNEWLHLLGEISYEEVLKEMLGASVFVLPTYTEGFPNVILESMACACPIIASDIGAIPEMLAIASDFPCGICIPPKEVKKLKESIEYMLDNRNISLNLAQQARLRVLKEYSVSSVWQLLMDVWTQRL